MHQYTIVLSTEVSLKCHGRRARLSLRAIAASPSKNNSGLLVDVYRLFEESFDKQQKRMDSFFDRIDGCFDRWNRKLAKISDEARVMFSMQQA